MNNKYCLIPKIKIHPSKIITYNEIHYFDFKPSREKKEFGNTSLITVEKDGKLELKRVSNTFLNSSRQGNGVLSKAAKKRLTLAIEYFLLLNKPDTGKTGNTGRHYKNKITFITLTLPSKQIHTDNEIKSKCLNQFLIELSKYHKVSQYVWRSEYQKNGNIHFHILTNRYIFWNDIRNRWNRIINKLGYVDRYRDNLKEYHKNGFQVRADLLKTWPLEQQKKAYAEGLKTDFHNPNSIDIHKIDNISQIQKYLTKYLTKEEQSKQPNLNSQSEELKGIGRTWGASIILSNIKGASAEIDSEIEEHLKTIEEHFNSQIFRSDYFTVIDITIEMIEQLKLFDLSGLFYRYLFKQFNHAHQTTF